MSRMLRSIVVVALVLVCQASDRALAICPGDANGDGMVDPLDSGLVLALFGCDPDGGGDCAAADVNGDGAVDPLDIGFTNSRFGDCPGSNCCFLHPGPGCDDPEIEACVCAFDGFCCEVTWDAACIEEVELFGCGRCSPDDCEKGTPPNDTCQCADIVPLANNETVTFTGDTTGAKQECNDLGAGLEEVWFAFSIDDTDNVFIYFCADTTNFEFYFTVLDDSCPCDGDFIFGASVAATCDDGSEIPGLRFANLPAGTYYYPLLAGDFGLDGLYVLRIARH